MVNTDTFYDTHRNILWRTDTHTHTFYDTRKHILLYTQEYSMVHTDTLYGIHTNLGVFRME
jgi:hypothetical protein